MRLFEAFLSGCLLPMFFIQIAEDDKSCWFTLVLCILEGLFALGVIR